ncbi:MAG: hypothetical protein WD406_06430, partial [Pseudohongiellaceae bacterium]
MENLLEIFSVDDLGWGLRVFIAVVVTLLLRFLAIKILDFIGKQAARTENLWDDALIQAGRPAVSWYVLILGLCWAAAISNAYIENGLFAEGNIDLVRKLSAIVLLAVFLVRFVNIVEKRMLNAILDAGSDWQGTMDATTVTALAKLLRLAAVISAVL